MNYGAVAHMPDQRYCYCLYPGRFLIRLQTGRDDLQEVKLHYRDKYIPLRLHDTRKSVHMNRVAQDHFHDYYEAEVDIDVVCLRYYFELRGFNGERMFFSNCRILSAPPQDIDRMYDLPQNLREIERFAVPQWAQNKVVYQIFPSRFATDQNVQEKKWYKAPIKSADDLQGNLRGIINRLDYLYALGVDIVYMTPIFQSNSSHKYDTIDYYTIDAGFGTTDDLIELVQRAHSMGMRVMLDAVFNHTAPEFFAFADLEKNWETSEYRDWYYCQGKPRRPKMIGVKPNYKCFSYFGGMPKLNLENPDTAQYVIDVALYWLRTAGIDGWRLDVGDEVSHYFWQKFRTAVKREFPEALIVGEIWHYAGDFLQGDTWDTVMNYPFRNAAMDFVAEASISATQFVNELGFIRGNVNNACYPILWNLIGSHDTPRALHCCGGNKNKLRLLAAMQLLLPGMPFLYYGDEVGLTGGPDPDCRRGMLWDADRQDCELFAYYQRLIRLRKKIEPFLELGLSRMTADDDTGVVAFETDACCILFHGADGSVQLPQYSGINEQITQCCFDGCLGPYQAAAFLK